jgi:hypothetical protein
VPLQGIKWVLPDGFTNADLADRGTRLWLVGLAPVRLRRPSPGAAVNTFVNGPAGRPCNASNV